jgi:MraZ protein
VAVFFGTFENKVDRKGRVSVPALFRQALTRSSFQGIVARASHRSPGIEAYDLEFMAQLNEGVATANLFSDVHDDLALTIFGEAYQLGFDGEGRVLLPPALIEHAGITERASFVGMGSLFQIWEPETLSRQKAEARARAREQGLTLPLRRGPGEAS